MESWRMSTFLASASAATSTAVLLWAGVSHVVHHSSFERALAAHELWPKKLVPGVAASVVAAEVAIGILGALAVVGITAVTIEVAFIAASVTYAAFSIYAAVLYWLRGEAACGCSSFDEKVNIWTIGRTVALTVGAVAALVLPASVFPEAMSVQEVTTITLASAALGLLLWNL